MHLILIQVKILRMHRRSECTYRLQRCSPQTGNHIYRKRQRNKRHKKTGNSYLIIIIVVREFNLTQQIESKQSKNHDPQSKERFTVEQSPSVCQIGYRQELKCECQFKKAQRHLYHIHPSTRLRHRFQP